MTAVFTIFPLGKELVALPPNSLRDDWVLSACPASWGLGTETRLLMGRGRFTG